MGTAFNQTKAWAAIENFAKLRTPPNL